jgi:hypothetical protein
MPFALETSATLPQNVKNPRFINIYTSVTEKYDGMGNVNPLGSPLCKVVTVSDVLSGTPANKRIDMAGTVANANLTEADALGSTVGQVNTVANVKVASLAWGVTDRLTIAGALPVLKIDVSTSTGFAANANGELLVRNVGAAGNEEVQNYARANLNDAVGSKLRRLGYQPIPTQKTISGVGDAQIIAKYKLSDDGVNSTAIKGRVILPTGIQPDADLALDIPTSDGRFGFGLSGIYDRQLPLDLRWDSYGAYTALLPHHIVKRIPTSEWDSLSADKEELYEKTRHQIAFGSGLEHRIPSLGIVTGAGYSFQYQTRADYEAGTAFDASRYYLLGDLQSNQALHNFVATAGFSTIEWYKAKKFVYPFQVNFSYMHPLAGRNVANSDLVAGELLLFF